MFRLSAIHFLVVLLLPAAVAHAQLALHTATEFHADARLIDIGADGRFVFQQKELAKAYAGNQVVRWSNNQATTPGTSVALSDGSWLAGQVQWPTAGRVRLASKWFDAIELDVDALRAIIVNPSPSWPEVQQLQTQMLAATGSQDILWKRGSESASGIVTIGIKKSIDQFSPDRAIWSFKSSASTVTTDIPQGEVAGVTFSPILRRPKLPTPDCFALHLTDGSRLIVRMLKRRDNGTVEVELASGDKLISLDESDEFVSSIAQVTAAPAQVVWLSDIEPARYRLLDSESSVPWPLGRNRDLQNARLFDAYGQAIDHALVVHAPAQVAYRSDGKPARLLSTIEILKPSSGGAPQVAIGSAQCQVLVGRNGQLTSVWQSEVLRAGQPPVMVNVDVSNAQLIVLLVDQADLSTVGDRVLWRDVRLVTE